MLPLCPCPVPLFSLARCFPVAPKATTPWGAGAQSPHCTASAPLPSCSPVPCCQWIPSRAGWGAGQLAPPRQLQVEAQVMPPEPEVRMLWKPLHAGVRSVIRVAGAFLSRS